MHNIGLYFIMYVLFLILTCSFCICGNFHQKECEFSETKTASGHKKYLNDVSEHSECSKTKSPSASRSSPNMSEEPAPVPTETNNKASFADWHFDKRQLLTETFPLDPIEENYVRQVRNAVFSKVYPSPMKTATHLVAISELTCSDILDLEPRATDSDFFKAFVSGSTFLDGSVPLAHRYGGHQFGYWAGQLGDGRAVLLGEYLNRKGERWELQLKGSGLTPYSRRGDGKAVLRSSVREFLCSEAMYHLGVPTSRALSISLSSDPVWRDQFYNGHPQQEPAAVVLRLAPSWFRIGSLEILQANQEIDLLRRLTDFVIQQYFPHIDSHNDDRYFAFYAEVVSQTAHMIAKWMSVGFAHGVMNTDNFSLLSITIDYGPFGFLDAYVPGFVPNSSDDGARYSYEKQPDIGQYNLDKLRLALLPLVDKQKAKQLHQILQGYADIYKKHFLEIFRKKLGLVGEDKADEYIVALLLKLMADTRADFTMSFRQLGSISIADLSANNILDELWALKDLQKHTQFKEWIGVYVARAAPTGNDDVVNDRKKRMNAVNPRYILRNWMAQEAISKAGNGDYTGVSFLLKVLENPYVEQELAERAGYTQRPPEWAKDIRVSCSS